MTMPTKTVLQSDRKPRHIGKTIYSIIVIVTVLWAIGVGLTFDPDPPGETGPKELALSLPLGLLSLLVVIRIGLAVLHEPSVPGRERRPLVHAFLGMFLVAMLVGGGLFFFFVCRMLLLHTPNLLHLLRILLRLSEDA